MKSIDTFYDGHYFRSRLEARWAAFFNELTIPYQYEPQGFKSEAGECYLPDFYLPDTYLRGDHKGLYIEIKPDNYNANGFYAHRVEDWFDRPLVLFKGDPRNNVWSFYPNDRPKGGYECWKERHDNWMFFWECAYCGTTKVEFGEGGYDNCPNCKKEGFWNGNPASSSAYFSSYERFDNR